MRRASVRDQYLAADDREAYLRQHSRLPGPRSNLELLDVAAAVSDRAEIERWAALTAEQAPTNTPGEFVTAVGIAGLGWLVAGGDRSPLATLRRASHDPRWRVREAVAIALQVWGDADIDALMDEMEGWVAGPPLEGRAAMAALCEPRLLASRSIVVRTLAALDVLTRTVRAATDRRAADLRVLRQALGYGWSVAVAAEPSVGLPAFEAWLADPDPDVRWIVRQNLAKSRLVRAAPGWVERALARVGAGGRSAPRSARRRPQSRP